MKKLDDATGTVLDDTENTDAVVVAVDLPASADVSVDIMQAVAVRFALRQLADGRSVTDGWGRA